MPEIKMYGIHLIFQQCHCPGCGKTVKVGLPKEASFGQRSIRLIGELSGIKARSRKDVDQALIVVKGIPITTATLQKWGSILISDNYVLYRRWMHGRQTCLAHQIRTGDAVAER